MPNLYIIGGCNGAGKTTASYTILPEMLNCKEFINADEIAKGLSPFQPEKARIDAGKIMLLRINEFIRIGIDFSFETTLSARHFAKKILEAQRNGYFVTLVFFWLNSVELAIQRVKNRVNEGGHGIPEDVIIRRYKMGIINLVNKYMPICDYWIIVNNSDGPLNLVAEGLKDSEYKIYTPSLWNKIKNQANE
jgi:predicted ABC-type ATPase